MNPEYRIDSTKQDKAPLVWKPVYLPIGCDISGKIIYYRTAVQVSADRGETI